MPPSKRLLIVCEGHTEASFVKQCLARHLASFNVWAQPSLLRTRPEKQGGGNVTVERVSINLANEYPNHDHLTTLLDFYGFRDSHEYGKEELERSILRETIKNRDSIASERITPYIQQYEFEGLLFSDPDCFEWVLDGWSKSTREQLLRIFEDHPNPEEINDGPSTAPSQRLHSIFGDTYRKTEHGPIIAEEIGLQKIRQHCPRFDHWLSQLEALATS